jgi:hypothetical protein
MMRSTLSRDVVAIGRALRSGVTIDDDAFDHVYPSTHRHRSKVHWTPVDVALLVSRWFTGAPKPRVLDVGAGVGKLCHVGALTTDLVCVGVESDATMVRIAARVARALEIEHCTSFILGEALHLDWTSYGAIYLFNPFNEAVYGSIPADPLIRQAAYIHEVLSVERKLVTLKPGVLVATYHGFGGEMPAELELVDRMQVHGGPAELWIRAPRS